MILKKRTPGANLPPPRAIYMYITIIIKDLFSETAWPIKAKRLVEYSEEGRKKIYINGQGHMTKMVAMAINSKKKL